ncbi:MAG: outer membrane lipoprotein-sorting protein [Verrucomicrobiota bacterium]
MRPASRFFNRQTARAVCLLCCLALPAESAAQSRLNRPAPRYLQIGEPDQTEGAKILDEFRQRQVDGDYYLEFILRVMPRRGDERRVPGRLWGGLNAGAPITRVEMAAATPEGVERILVQGGPAPRAWRAVGGAATAIDPGALFEPLAGTDLTMFEVQLPFLYWPEFVFEGVARLRGRPAHVFLLYPPENIASQRPDLHGVRVYLDTQFGVLVQAEQIGQEDRVLKTLSILELKKIGERWMVKTIDLRDERTRDKTRFAVTAAALGLKLPEGVFAPATLTGPAVTPSSDLLTRLDP